MSGIVLTSSVRQNLLSLQSTADLLSTTQNRLATGNKVNSALDNPTNFFTAQGLNNRASDINNLLDSIGNGVQVLQAANTGITSLQKLVDTAKSIANQVLQAPTGYSAKSTVTSAAALGGTAANLVDGATIKSGQTIIVAANGALPAVTVTIGASKSLDQLNTALAPGQPDGQPGQLQQAGLHHDQRLCFVHDRCGYRRLDARLRDVRRCRCSRCRRRLADHPLEPGQAVQRHHHADQHHVAGFVLQRHQPAERR